jgi:hypothetical protein
MAQRDLQETLDNSPMTSTQIVTAILYVASNALDGFGVLSIASDGGASTTTR